MNNLNNAGMNNKNNINSINNVSNKVINNFSNINSFVNTNNMNNTSKMNSVTNTNNINSMITLNNMNSIPNFSNTNNIDTMNPINNINSVSNNNNSISNNVNSVANVNNTNTNTVTTMNNMNTVGNATNNNGSILNSMSSINNSNSTNNVNGMKSFLFLQNVTECSNHEVTMSKEQEKDKKTEKNERMDVEESGDTPPTQNSPNMKNTEINYSQAKIDEIKANLTEKNSVYASPIFSKKSLINVHLSPTADAYENKSAITSNNFIQKKNLFSQNSLNEQTTDNSNTINNKIESQPGPKNSINDASIFGGKLIDVLNNEITKNNKSNNKSINNNDNDKTENLQENVEKKDEIVLSQKAQNILADLNSNSNISNNTNNINSVNANPSLQSQRSEKKETNISSINYSSLFMFPIFKTNVIKGAVDKAAVQEIKISFSQFSEEDLILTEFPSGGAYCNYENFFYFSGGQEYIKEASKLFLSISKKDSTQSPNKLPCMKNPHWNHSMIGDKEKIYVIGGYNSNKCEVYDIQAKTWSELPDLLSPERQRSMLFIEKNFLYCFMGTSQNGILDTTERLNLDNTQAGWERINIDNSDNLNLKFYGAGIIRMKEENKLLFIGGKKESNNEEVYKRSIYEFSFDDFKMTLSDFKIENDLDFVENILYQIDDTDYGNFINIGDGYLISMPPLTK